MNVQLFSDVHLEFFRDGGKAFIKGLDPTGVDVLVVAGDLGNCENVISSLEGLCGKYPQVVYVLGNHELYGSTPQRVLEKIRALEGKTPNLTFLDNASTVIGGVKFAGTTLWFPDDPLNFMYEKQLSDFSYIRNFKPWVYEQNRLAHEFLAAEAADADMVITHHIPSNLCVAPQYQGSPLNRFFVSPIADKLPALPKRWVFGHTHTPGEWEMGGCTFTTNPLGYPHESKKGYQEKLVFEVLK